MSKKQDLQNNVDSRLASAQVGGITAQQHRATLKDDSSSIINEFYKDPVTDSEATQSIFEIITSGTEFDITVTKQGRFIHVWGGVTNNTGGTLSNLLRINDTNSEYFGYESFARGLATTTPSISNTIVVMSSIPASTTLVAEDGLGDGQTIFFNGSAFKKAERV